MTDDEVKAYKRRWYEAHKEEHNARCKRWRQSHIETVRGFRRKWAEKNPEKFKESKRKTNRKIIYNYLADEYKWEDVEGYDGWTVNTVVHHRWEVLGYSVAELKAMGKYYGCRAAELLCMTPSEHQKLHHQIKRDIVR